MEKTKKKLKEIENKDNGQEKKLTKEEAMEILEREIQEDTETLLRKQGALSILKQID